MDNITEMLLGNFTTICLVIGLAIITLTNQNLDKKTNRSFVLFVFIVFALVVTDAIDYYLAGSSDITILRYITSAAGYTLRPASLVVVIDILLRRKKSVVIMWIPVVLIGIIAFTSYYTHLMFWFGEHNEFMRGPLSYVTHIVGGIYLIMLVVLTVRMHRYITSGEIFTVIYIAVICLAATVLESKLSGYKFLLTGAMATSCALYYVIIYIETYRRDPLTGLMNRKSFYMDANRLHSRTLAVISVDLNGLKEINDTKGHSAGDAALQCMGNAMLVKSGDKFLAYRVGGDEFMAIGKEQTAESVITYIEDMRYALEQNGLMAAFGYDFYKAGDDFDDICNLADANMYTDKKHCKHREAAREQ